MSSENKGARINLFIGRFCPMSARARYIGVKYLRYKTLVGDLHLEGLPYAAKKVVLLAHQDSDLA